MVLELVQQIYFSSIETNIYLTSINHIINGNLTCLNSSEMVFLKKV
ncbi:hypothetical protein KCTC32420_01056 [Aequorivita nionensis]|jgi:hypothetical protein